MTRLPLLLSIAVALCWGNICCGFQSKQRVRDLAEKALAVIRQSNDEQYQAKLLSEVALLLSRNGDPDSAQLLFKTSLAQIPDGPRSNQIVDIAKNLARAGLFEESQLAASRARNKETTDFQPWRCLSEIVEVVAFEGDCVQARMICDGIGNDHYRALGLIQLAVVAFNRGDKASALTLINEAVRLAANVREEPFPLLTEEIIVERVTRAGLKELIPELVEQVIDDWRSNERWTFVMLIEAQCGNEDGVLRAWEEQKKTPISPYSHEIMLDDLVLARVTAGHVDDARETARELENSSNYALTARIVSKALIDAKRLMDAQNMIEAMRESDRNSWPYFQTMLDLAEAHFSNGNNDSAKGFLTDARERAMHMKLAPHRSDFAAIGEVYGQHGLEAEFETWANALESPYAKATAFIGLANGILKRDK